MSEDGWEVDNEIILTAYGRIDKELSQRPIEKEVKEPEDPKQKKIIETEDNVYCLPDDSDDDNFYSGRKPCYFKPPLQVQRNHFVKNTLKSYIHEKRYFLKKLAVLGCGESSLEKFLAPDIASTGIERIMSVDIEEACLAKGIRLFRQQSKQISNSIKGTDRLPVLYEHYLGDILKYDERLVGTDCVCSTEVIEHISVQEAEKFVRLVLDQIRPKLFILSTPNHEYNKAFGMQTGEFRHDDHKYEFTRKEFIDWVKNILKSSGFGYNYSIHYVGNINGYKDLQGATQFVIFSNKEQPCIKPYALTRNYEKVADRVACGGIYKLFIQLGRSALKKWLQENKVDKTNLIVTEYAEFWHIPLCQILELMNIPKIVCDNIPRENMLNSLKSITKGRLFAQYGHGTGEDFLIIPGDCHIDYLIDFL